MRVEQLTFLRFIAAAIVVFFHFGKDVINSPALTSGPEMVTFFFVLSGFVMGITYFNRKMLVTKYLWERGARITPVYFLALSMILAAYFIRGRELDPTSLILNITLLQSWLSPHPLSLNGPGWSISVEVFFYICFPFILYFVRKLSLTSLHIGIYAFFVWVVTHVVTTILINYYYEGFPSLAHDLIFYFPLTHLCSFIFGVAGAAFFVEANNFDYSRRYVSVLLLVVFSSIFFILENKRLISDFIGFRLAFSSSLLSPIFASLIVLISLSRSSLFGVFHLYPFVLLGEASYSLYILQQPIYLIYSEYFSSLLQLEPSVNFCVFFVLLVSISIVTFLCFERPLNKILRRYYYLFGVISKKCIQWMRKDPYPGVG